MSESGAPITPGTLRMSEALESLNGFETIGIEDYWGRNLDEISSTRLTLGVVAMLLKRSGTSTKDAWQQSKTLTLKQLNDWFAPELEADLIEGDEGKARQDDSAPAT